MFLPAAQAELDALIQGRTRLFCLGLAGLNTCVGLLNVFLLRPRHLQVEVPLALLTLGALAALSVWLRKPRPPFLVDFAAGTSALLAVSGALMHLALSGNLQDTTHLLLIVVGAGFFLFSLAWFLMVAGLSALGWAGVILAGGTYEFSLHYAIELGTAILLGLLIHVVRRYLLKRFLDLLTAKHRNEGEQTRMLAELREAHERVKTLRGLIPICAQCKQIRDDQGYWQQVEDFVHDHSEAVFSHGLCPVCLAKTKAEFEAFQKEP